MAQAVEHAFETGEHLAVQAGTGTGKSLAYLVPAIARAITTHQPVVVSTATIALQRQLVDRDLPRLADALAPALSRRPDFALLKGRGNYLCLNKIHSGATNEPEDATQEEMFDAIATTALGRDVQRLTEWASDTETGDRDELTPGVPDRSWSQVSVSARECIGATRCPFGTDCFAEKARDKAGHADVVVTNHALLAIDAISDVNVLPEHELLIVDEAHELVDRVTSVASGELSATALGVAHRRAARLVEPELAQRLEATIATFTSAIHDAEPGRIDTLDDELTTFLTAVRDAADRVRSTIDTSPTDPKAAAARSEAVTALSDVSDTASRILTSFGPAIPDRTDVVWLDHDVARGTGSALGVPPRAGRAKRHGDQTRRAVLRVAPLSVSNLLRGRTLRELDGHPHLGDPDGGWHVRLDGPVLGADVRQRRRRQVARHRRRITVRAREVGHPLRRRPSATAGPRRRRIGRATRRDRGPHHRRRRSHARTLLVDAGGQGRCRGDARPARHSRCCARARTPRRRWSVGSPTTTPHRCSARCRCGRASTCQAPSLSLVHHRPNPVPAARRSARHGPAAGHRRARRQRLHGRRRQPRCAAARPGRRAAAARRRRPRRGRGARLPDGDRPLRRVSAGVAAAVLGDDRRGAGAQRAGTPTLPIVQRHRSLSWRGIHEAPPARRSKVDSRTGVLVAAATLLVAACSTTVQGTPVSVFADPFRVAGMPAVNGDTGLRRRRGRTIAGRHRHRRRRRRQVGPRRRQRHRGVLGVRVWRDVRG